MEYKTSLDLYQTVSKNERYFAGDQWNGVHAPDLPKPVINFIKRACQQKIAEVKENPTAVCFSPAAGTGKTGNTGDAASGLLNALFAADWERLKMDYVNLEGLYDACISGDYILYDYWDPGIRTAGPVGGGVCVETVDNVNFYPDNPNERDIQKQPGILLARREPLENVRREAAFYGMPQSLIEGDRETLYQSGDMAGQELGGSGNEKCVTLLYLHRDPATGRVTAMKCARGGMVRAPWDTRLTRYPLAMMNWERRKNCCFGRAEVTGLIPVQRYINQMYAMAMLCTMQSACPKPVFNQGMVKAWSNAVGAAIPVNGDIDTAVKYLEPPALSADAYNLPERLMRTTLEMAGVTNVSLGNVDPNNYSAMLVAQQTTSAPMENVKSRFYSMTEDFALNWLDMRAAFGDFTKGGLAGLEKDLWKVKIDVGASTVWSEAAAVQTLAGLYKAGAINARQYIERMPDGTVPMREKLLREMDSTANENGKDEMNGISGISGTDTAE